MNTKACLKCELDKDSLEKIQHIKNELTAYQPVWKLLSRLFDRFQLKEYEVLILDIHFLLNHVRLTPERINVVYLLSLSKSCELLANRFTTDMLETYHSFYEMLHVSSVQLRLMYESYSEQIEASVK